MINNFPLHHRANGQMYVTLIQPPLISLLKLLEIKITLELMLMYIQEDNVLLCHCHKWSSLWYDWLRQVTDRWRAHFIVHTWSWEHLSYKSPAVASYGVSQLCGLRGHLKTAWGQRSNSRTIVCSLSTPHSRFVPFIYYCQIMTVIV